VIFGRVLNANIAQTLEVLLPFLRQYYCLITVIDSSPSIVQGVGERLISRGFHVRLVGGCIEIRVCDLLELPEQDLILNEFDEMYLISKPVSVNASSFERFPGEVLFEKMPQNRRQVLGLQMESLGADAFLSDGVGVNCAFTKEEFARTIVAAGYEFLAAHTRGG